MKKFPLFHQKQLLHLRNFIKNTLFLSLSRSPILPGGLFLLYSKINKVFYKAKNLPASHPFQTGKQTDFFLYSATIFCSQTPFLTRTNPITHLIRSTDITIK